MINTLELYCKFKGWNGGTIHQAMEDFSSLTKAEQDKFCGILVDTMLENTDINGVSWFMENRISHLGGVK